jgi:peptidyl-dipeptidase A
MKTLVFTVGLVLMMVVFSGCDSADDSEAPLQVFVDSHVAKIRPMAKEAALASWKAANTGEAADYDKVSELVLKIRKVYTNSEEYAFLKEMKESGEVKEEMLARQLELLYNSYLENQIDAKLLEEIVKLETEVEKKFSTFRGTIDGRRVTDNEIKDILKSSADSAERKKTWLASKQVGAEVADDLIRLIKLRNKAAKKLGFKNYHHLRLAIGEQDVAELDKVFGELYDLTNGPFTELKAELDGILAANCGIERSELRPWHYHDPFFQETPLVYELDLDKFYKGRDIKQLSMDFYKGIGLPVESIIANSDLYEREGKNPHAFCTDIDREGDVRILCNIKDNETWMETQLHELGHAVYDKNFDTEMPFLLRGPTHAFTTEGIAMFFGRLSRNPVWMQQMLSLTDAQRAEIEKVSGKYMQLKQLIFARWAMVMYNFEKALYANPDADVNKLWWDMVEKFQFLKREEGRDEPDWAAKIHFTIAPCYYHNYLLGELFASQFQQYIVRNVLKLDSDEGVSYVGRADAGRFLRENVFEPGSLYQWNEMIERATGEKLTAKHFVADFVE